MFLPRSTLARDEHAFRVACHFAIRLSIATKIGDCPTIASGAPSQRAVTDRARMSTACSQRNGAMTVGSSARVGSTPRRQESARGGPPGSRPRHAKTLLCNP